MGIKNIDINMFVSLKENSRTRRLEVTLVKSACILGIRKYSFSLRTDMFKTSLTQGGLHIDDKCWTLDKPMAYLSTCHLGLWFGWQSR